SSIRWREHERHLKRRHACRDRGEFPVADLRQRACGEAGARERVLDHGRVEHLTRRGDRERDHELALESLVALELVAVAELDAGGVPLHHRHQRGVAAIDAGRGTPTVATAAATASATRARAAATAAARAGAVTRRAAPAAARAAVASAGTAAAATRATTTTA